MWVRRARILGCVLLLGTGGCLIEPCDIVDALLSTKWMTGSWTLVTVNGDPIPQQGVPIPTTSDRLIFGALNFQKIRHEGSLGSACDEYPEDEDIVEHGRVLAIYTIVDANGQPKPSKVYAGSYTYHHSTGRITLRADKGSIVGNVDDQLLPDMTYAQTIPFIGSYTVVFRRSS